MSLINSVNNRQTVFTFRLLIHMTEIYSSIAGHHDARDPQSSGVTGLLYSNSIVNINP